MNTSFTWSKVQWLIIGVLALYIFLNHYLEKPCPPASVVTKIDTVYLPDNTPDDYYTPEPDNVIYLEGAKIGRLQIDSFAQISSTGVVTLDVTSKAKTKPKTKSKIESQTATKIFPSASADSLKRMLDSLTVEYHSLQNPTLVYIDTINVQYGYIQLTDTVDGVITARRVQRFINYPVITKEITTPQKRKNEWHIGPKVLGNTLHPVRYAGGSIFMTTRKNKAFSIDLVTDFKGEVIYGGSMLWKLRFNN